MNNQGTGSIYSKFRERLRKIKLSRIKKKQQNEEFIKDRVQEIKKLAPQRNVDKVTVVKNSQIKLIKDNKTVAKRIVSSNVNKINIKEETVAQKVKVSKDKDLENKILDIKENKPKTIRNRKVHYKPTQNINNISTVEKKELLNKKGLDILEKLKDNFEDKIDELEVLSSELYILNEKQNSELELNKVNEIKKRINELVEKINNIIEQYNLYKKNYYIDNVIGIDDSIIVDDIINYRELLNSLDSEKKFVKEYKALEEFKSLYSNLDEIKKQTESVMANNEEKIIEYQIRDKKYNEVKLSLISVLDIDKKCIEEINKQNKYFDNLMKEINVINSREYVTKHLNGIGELIGQSLKYMGLMLLSPLAGLIPGIAVQTLATKRMIGNVYKRLHLEEVKHIHYEAINYDNELNQHLNDVNYTEKLIEDTIDDVVRLKEHFMMIYNSNLPGYDETLKKIIMIENKLFHNQHKVSIVKRNLNKGKKLNNDKLIMVKKLNNQ